MCNGVAPNLMPRTERQDRACRNPDNDPRDPWKPGDLSARNLSAEQLQALADEVGPEQSLLVCCSAFRGVTAARAAERWPNLTLKKIPKMVLARCHWGRDDYSLNVANLPMAEPEPEVPSSQSPPRPAPARRRGRKAAATPDLFGDAGEEAS